jgi:hypothetical protein
MAAALEISVSGNKRSVLIYVNHIRGFNVSVAKYFLKEFFSGAFIAALA